MGGPGAFELGLDQAGDEAGISERSVVGRTGDVEAGFRKLVADGLVVDVPAVVVRSEVLSSVLQ